MKIKVEKLSADELKKRGVLSWPVWEKERSRFPWHYDAQEECYFLEGRVTVESSDGVKTDFGAGDFVTFPKGLEAVWIIHEPVRKHYRFGSS
jgi:uncharacterized protein